MDEIIDLTKCIRIKTNKDFTKHIKNNITNNDSRKNVKESTTINDSRKNVKKNTKQRIGSQNQMISTFSLKDNDGYFNMYNPYNYDISFNPKKNKREKTLNFKTPSLLSKCIGAKVNISVEKKRIIQKIISSLLDFPTLESWEMKRVKHFKNKPILISSSSSIITAKGGIWSLPKKFSTSDEKNDSRNE